MSRIDSVVVAARRLVGTHSCARCSWPTELLMEKPDQHPECVLRRALEAYEARGRAFDCYDCGGTGYDLYMVHDHIWRETFGLRRGILCFTCADTRIRAAFGRPLTPSLDLQALPCNKPYFLVEQNILAIEADRPKS